MKCRHLDRYVAGVFDLSDSDTHKEDMIAPYVSKFSLSSNFEKEKNRKLIISRCSKRSLLDYLAKILVMVLP